MKKIKLETGIYDAVRDEYSHPAPQALRERVRRLMLTPFARPWQLIFSVFLLALTPICLHELFNAQALFGNNILLIINVFIGCLMMLIIYTGIAQYIHDPTELEVLSGKVRAFFKNA